MDIHSSLDGLKSLLGVPQATPPAAQQARNAATASGSALGNDRATLSSAGNEVSLAATDTGVRADKVAGIQAALAAGTYDVSPAAVASKMVDSMLGGGQ